MEKFLQKLNSCSKSQRRKLISAFASLIFSAIVMLTSITAAWFANNRDVASNGMQMSVETTPNLVISDSESAISSMTASGATFSVTFNSGRDNMYPATHAGTGAVKLQYVSDSSVVDINSGLAKDGSSLTMADVVSSSSSLYYVDFTVYIASVNKALTTTGVTAAFSTTTTNDTHKATSVDFYVDGTYVDTLNLAGLNYSVNDASTAKTSVSLGITEVPLNTEDSIAITMRCYFDGALEKVNDTTTFINSASVDTTQISFGILFSAAASE